MSTREERLWRRHSDKAMEHYQQAYYTWAVKWAWHELWYRWHASRSRRWNDKTRGVTR